MKCKVCGAESGKYPLCKTCNTKRETGEIIKCPKCNNWHYANISCPEKNNDEYIEEKFLYQLKSSLVTTTEQKYLSAIKSILPEGCLIQPQANLASFITRNDNARFQNELYRNVDFLIMDIHYKPMVIIEINDQSHLSPDRKERDEKVKKICEEAGIPIIKLWTSYGINTEYISKRINEAIASLPAKRIPHFIKNEPKPASIPVPEPNSNPEELTVSQPQKKAGCYVATCIYGSYNCPQVWTLRRFRDNILAVKWYGRLFIRLYYFISPSLVKLWGNNIHFRTFCKKHLDVLIIKLHSQGIKDTPYDGI